VVERCDVISLPFFTPISLKGNKNIQESAKNQKSGPSGQISYYEIFY